jgi:hypothetical protein
VRNTGKTVEDAHLTGDVLIDEYQAVHGEDLKQKYEQINGANTWSSLQDSDRQSYYFQNVHFLKKDDTNAGQTALCLSGGGIRSAAFALGVMQGLAKLGLLSKFHYLSTVSGGGYAGAWLTAWAKRAVGQIQAGSFRDLIENELAKSGEVPEPLSELRKYQAFLTPKVGIASPDTWAATAIVIRNMLLNWLVFIPVLASILLVPRLIQSFLLYWTDSTITQSSILVALWEKLANPSKPLDISLDPHTWLDGVAALLVGFGICFSMVNRSKAFGLTIDDKRFNVCSQ